MTMEEQTTHSVEHRLAAMLFLDQKHGHHTNAQSFFPFLCDILILPLSHFYTTL